MSVILLTEPNLRCKIKLLKLQVVKLKQFQTSEVYFTIYQKYIYIYTHKNNVQINEKFINIFYF